MLLHGFPNTNYQWREQIVALAEAGFSVIAPNQRGYSSGARPKGIESYTSEKLVEDVRKLLMHYIWKAFTLQDMIGAHSLLGSSLGNTQIGFAHLSLFLFLIQRHLQ